MGVAVRTQSLSWKSGVFQSGGGNGEPLTLVGLADRESQLLGISARLLLAPDLGAGEADARIERIDTDKLPGIQPRHVGLPGFIVAPERRVAGPRSQVGCHANERYRDRSRGNVARRGCAWSGGEQYQRREHGCQR